MNDDRAGSLPHVDVKMTGKEYTPQDEKLVQSTVFYLQELIKLFPRGAQVALVATWEEGGNTRQTVNFGTLSNMEVVLLLAEVEKQHIMEKIKAAGNG